MLFVVFCFVVIRRWARVLLETLDMSVSHSCAWTWISMTIVCAYVASDLYVMLSSGFSLKMPVELSLLLFVCGNCPFC